MIKGLYIHIPFCHTVCSYCDFSKMVAGDALIDRYMSVLLEEIMSVRSELESLETLYIGGGTPTRLTLLQMSSFLTALKDIVSLKNLKEITMEANPEDITVEYAKMLKAKGINRISLGAQTMDYQLLKVLNRSHRQEDLIRSVNILRDCGFDNINIDMIYGIPYQTYDILGEDLQILLRLRPDHISYYALILEEHTLLYHQVMHHKLQLPDEDLVADFSDLVSQELKKAGYHHYEISNYAKPGKQSLHNLLYWRLEPYLGVGLNAASQYQNKRFRNKASIRDYLQNYQRKTIETFEPEKEFLIMGLRTTEGISKSAFQVRFFRDVFEVFPALKKHLKTGLLINTQERLFLSERGMDLANQVYLDII